MLTANTRIVGAGDIDDDGCDDLIVRSGWGMGILRPIGGWMSSLWMNAWGWPGPLAPEFSGPIWSIAEADADPIMLDADGTRGVELLMRR